MIYKQTPPPPTSICIQHFVALHCNHEPITHKCTPMTLQYTASLTDMIHCRLRSRGKCFIFVNVFWRGEVVCQIWADIISTCKFALCKNQKKGRLSPEWGLSSETCPKAWTHSFRGWRTARSERCISQPPLKQINPLKPWRAFSYILARGRWLD